MDINYTDRRTLLELNYPYSNHKQSNFKVVVCINKPTFAIPSLQIARLIVGIVNMNLHVEYSRPLLYPKTDVTRDDGNLMVVLPG